MITQKQKDIIWSHVNPEGHNPKQINWYKIIGESPEGYQIEIGYWITYLGARPRYMKDVIFIPRDKFIPSK